MGVCGNSGVRLLTLTVCHILYLILGAAIFAAIEGPEEARLKEHLRGIKFDFLHRHNACTTVYIVGEGYMKGIPFTRFAGFSEARAGCFHSTGNDVSLTVCDARPTHLLTTAGISATVPLQGQ
ncbi:hypothetical protein ACOMHN_026538 [Nucella lapillus]